MAVRRDLGRAQFERARATTVRVLEVDLDARDVVLAGGCKAAPGAAAAGRLETVCATKRAPRSKQLRKEVTEVSARTGRATTPFAASRRELEAFAPVGRRAKFLPLAMIGAELVVGRALLRILEDGVGLLQVLEARLGMRVLADVGMKPAGKLAVCALDVVLARVARDTHDRVVILELHAATVDLPHGRREP